MQQRLAAAVPVGLHGASAGEDDGDVRVNGAQSAQELRLILRYAHVLPVDALGLAALVEPQPQQHRVGAHGKLAGAGREPKATAAMAPVARLEADDGNALVPERIEAAVEPRRLYARAA